MMPCNHLILCRPLLQPSIFPNIRVFSNESALCIRWPKYWSFSFSISPSNKYSGWFPLGLTGLSPLFSKGLSRVFASTTVTKHQSFCALPSLHPTLIPVHDYWKNRSLDYMDLWWQSDVFNMLSRFLIVRYYSDIKNILSLLLLLLSRFSCVQLCVTP